MKVLGRLSVDAAERLYELAKALPEEQAVELLDFAEFLLQKRSRQQSVEEVARDKANYPLDFRQAAGLGQEVWQNVDVEQYIQQERDAWD
jgi:signal-transduction protein with cAMP-binding, CBS, and nucleotidyltransferase domain